MLDRFSISAKVLQAVLNELGKRPFVEVEALINLIRKDIKPEEVVVDKVEHDKEG